MIEHKRHDGQASAPNAGGRSAAGTEWLRDAIRTLAAGGEPADLGGRLCQLPATGLAVWCAIDTFGDGGARIRLGAALGRSPGGQTTAPTSIESPHGPAGAAPAARETQPGTLTSRLVDRAILDSLGIGAHALERLSGIDPLRLIVVPVAWRGRPLGELLLLRAGGGAGLTAADEASLTSFAALLAIWLDNLRLAKEVDESNRISSDLVSFASHDLRGPLTAISGLAQLLQHRASRIEDADAERLLGGLRQIQTATERMTALLDELMDVARLRFGKRLALDLKRAELIQIVHAAAAAMQRTTRQQEIRVESADPHLVGVWDVARLERAVCGLIGTGLKYAGVDGKVTIATRPERGAEGHFAVIEVRVWPSQHLRQGEETSIGEPVGLRPAAAAQGFVATALALPGVRGIIEQHGGTLAAAPASDEGGAMIVKLPSLAAAEAEGPSDPAQRTRAT